jgi:hypothetical protein
MDALHELTRGLFGIEGLSAATRGLLVAQPAHPRTRIRGHVVQILKVNAIAPERVYDSLPLPISYADLPAIFVYTLDEQGTQLDKGPRRIRRTIPLKVDVVLAVGEEQPLESLALAADTIGHLVETILSSDRYLGGTASDLLYTGTQAEFEDGGEGVVLHSVLSFDVHYDVVVTEGLIDGSLRSVRASWDTFPPNDGVLEAEDDIQLQEPSA